MASRMPKAAVFLGLAFIISYALFSLTPDYITPHQNTTTTIEKTISSSSTSSSSSSSSTSSSSSFSSSSSSSTSSSSTSSSTSSTTTTLVELKLVGGEPVLYGGYEIALDNIVSSDEGYRYVVGIKTPDGAVDGLEILDRFVLDGIEFGVLERLKGLAVRVYVRPYGVVVSKAPEGSRILSLGGKNFFSFQRGFADHKLRLQGSDLYVEEPDGRVSKHKLPDSGGIVVGDLEVGVLQLRCPGGYTAVYLRSSYDFTFSDSYIGRNYSYNNVHTTLGLSADLRRALINPRHVMQEREGSYVYSVDTGYIPMQDLYRNGDLIDLEYRGKIFFAGKEFYVMDIDGDRIYLVEGTIRDGLDNIGYSEPYRGYRFKVYGLSSQGSELSLLVEGPGGEESKIALSPGEVSVVDDCIVLQPIDASRNDGILSADIFVYSIHPMVILEDSKQLTHHPDWIVELGVIEQPFGEEMSVQGYWDIDEGLRLLKNITVVLAD